MDSNALTNNSEQLEEMNRVKRDLAVLYEVSNAMRTTLDLDHILYIILTGVTAHKGLGFNRAILFLVNPLERCLEPRLAIGPESGEHAQRVWNYISSAKQELDDLIKVDRVKLKSNGTSPILGSVQDLKIPLSIHVNNILSNAYHSGQPLHIKPDEIHQYESDPLFQKFQTKEVVVMPLKAKDVVNGLIVADNLYTQKPITNEDLKIFMMLANQAGLAIENSQLYELVKQKSHTDALTGLWNHGFFQNQLAAEMEQAKENDLSLSLIFLDIDNFKKLNDKHGHQNGDIILKNIAQLLQDSSRNIDYVCRYGGEEIALILTQTNKAQGFAIAERIRQRIERHDFPQFSAEKNLRVTMSVGLATYPDDADDKEELIAQADKAMYIAKFGGKNQTCTVPTTSS